MGGLAATALPGFLAACGGGGGTGTGTGAAESSATVGGTLVYLGWQGLDYPELLAPWRKKHGVQFEPTFISNMSDISAKYAAGGANAVDVINLSSNGTIRLSEAGVPFMPLDLEQVPNYGSITSYFKEDPTEQFVNDKGETVAVPISWGALGLNYDSKTINAPTAWSDLLEPEFKGKITIIDDPSTCFGLGSCLLKYKANELTPDKFEDVKNLLSEYVAQAKQVSPTFGDMANLLASGEVVASFGGYSPVEVFAAEAGNADIKTVIELEDGSASFAECYAIPSTGHNPATAYSMINTLLSTQINAEAGNLLYFAPTVEAAAGKADAAVKKLYPQGADAIAEFLEGAPLVPDPPTASDEFATFGEVTEAWTEIKSAAS